jgi:hypothetical protein
LFGGAKLYRGPRSGWQLLSAVVVSVGPNPVRVNEQAAFMKLLTKEFSIGIATV